MTSTQTMREILQAAKGMLPASQQSTQNMMNIEEMARNLVAKKVSASHEKSEEEKAKEREMEEMKKKIEDVLKKERACMDKKSSSDGQKLIFYEKYEDIASTENGAEKPKILIFGKHNSDKIQIIEAIVGEQFYSYKRSVAVPVVFDLVYSRQLTQTRCTFKENGRWTEFNLNSVDDVIKGVCEQIGESNVCAQPIEIQIVSNNVIPSCLIDLPSIDLEFGNDKMKSKVDEMYSLYLAKNNVTICVDKYNQKSESDSARNFAEQKNMKNPIFVLTDFDEEIHQMKTKTDLEQFFADDEKYDEIYVSVVNEKCQNSFKKELDEKHLECVKRLASLGIGEHEKEKIGMWRLKEMLENRVLSLYDYSIDTKITEKRKSVIELEKQVSALQEEERNFVADDELKSLLRSDVSGIGNLIIQLITGECTVNPKEYGETIGEERQVNGGDGWGGLGNEIDIVGKDMKLYGGAQYERLMRETEAALLTLELPVPTADEVCVAMGIHAIGGMLNGGERVVSVVIKTKAAQALNPVINILTRRIVHIFERLFDVAIGAMENITAEKSVFQTESVNKALKDVYVKFVKDKLKRCEKMLKEDLNSFVAVVDWNMLSNGMYTQTEDVEEIKADETDEEKKTRIKQKVQSIMEVRGQNELKILQELRNIGGAESHPAICKICQKVFGVIRESFWRNTRSKLNAYFLQPMIGEVKEELSRQIPVLDNVLLSSRKSEEERKRDLENIKGKKSVTCEEIEKCTEAKNLLKSINTERLSQVRGFEEPQLKKKLNF
ncbi:hypothetical protein EIN_080030 [Entamoeba invadens IP1]|uniref:hypothetical protein n=1 Tax=Entamoeba invadens IP1 TaxID=370355 RepID=UPI0002C3D9C1|nr:hypothetical protein EIN_080030 [Entamoeba invadens IP1]ELP85051.1 hypothetical protein EIN_080030 [Entamoeba invadens IP1]|eukprot:XP_004184397.1 hypothetical protein EIN_080030 [Entamoeba invadens IP1]